MMERLANEDNKDGIINEFRELKDGMLNEFNDWIDSITQYTEGDLFTRY